MIFEEQRLIFMISFWEHRKLNSWFILLYPFHNMSIDFRLAGYRRQLRTLQVRSNKRSLGL